MTTPQVSAVVQELRAGFKELAEALSKAKKEEKDEETLTSLITRTRGKIPPLSFHNAQIIKDPLMWLLLLERLEATREKIVSSLGTPGEITQAFRGAVEMAYPTDLLRRGQLLCHFQTIALAFVYHPPSLGAENLLMQVAPTVQIVESLIMELDAGRIGETLGEEARLAYVRNLSIRATDLPMGCEGALKQALSRSANSVPTKRQAERNCNLCGEEIPEGTFFRQHRSVCKGRGAKKAKKE